MSKAKLAQMLVEKERRESQKLFYHTFPDEGPLSYKNYPKHMEFLAATKEYSECAFIAGNRTGKTRTAAYFVACAMTGIYPDWWEGKVFKSRVRCWAAGDTNQTVRDVVQDALLGPPEAVGTGMIPGPLLIEGGIKKKAGSVPNAIESFSVEHKTGGKSHCTFKSYDQKRESFQGVSLDVVWFDEEPPIDIYYECLRALMTTGGVLICTFTPLRGLSEVVLDFMRDRYGDHRE